MNRDAILQALCSSAVSSGLAYVICVQHNTTQIFQINIVATAGPSKNRQTTAGSKRAECAKIDSFFGAKRGVPEFVERSNAGELIFGNC
jgi:hypothetical protein